MVEVQLTMVTRQGCHLCDEALGLLRELGYEPELADVDADDALHAVYDWRVPVLLMDGAVVAEGNITRGHLIKALGHRNEEEGRSGSRSSRG